MLDILLRRLKEEIAIDGSTGSSIEQVWEYVESISKVIAKESGASIVPLVDEKYRAFIWNYLKLESDLEFYENIAPQEPEHEPEVVLERIDNAVPETDKDVIELMKQTESEQVESISKKRKNPPSSKKKVAPRKKSKSKTKKKTTKRTVTTVDSDDDFEAGDTSSSSESEFEDDTEDTESEFESEGNISDEDKVKSTNNTFSMTKAPKAANTTLKKKIVKTTLSRIEDLSDLTYEDMVEKYGSRLYVTGSLELQEQQLYVGIPPGAQLPTNPHFILKEIIKTRGKGLLQANITKYLVIDSRSTGHYCKVLEERGAIIRQGVSTQKMRTNICIHARFVVTKETAIDIDEDDDIPYNIDSKGIAYSQAMLRDKLIDLVRDSPNHRIISEDVMRALGFNNTRKSVRKWFNRTVNELCEKGYIRKSNVKVVGSGKPRRCLELIKLPEESTYVEGLPIEEFKFPIKIKSNRNHIPVLPFPVDCSMESQIVQILYAAGEHGATQREIQFALNSDDRRVVYRLLEKICELKGVGLERFGGIRLLEFEGKLRRYRYYSYVAHKKVKENIDFTPPNFPDDDADEPVVREIDLFVDVPHSLREYMKFNLNRKKALGTYKPTKKKNRAGQYIDPDGPPPKLGRPKKNPGAPPRKKSKKVLAAEAAAAAAASSAQEPSGSSAIATIGSANNVNNETASNNVNIETPSAQAIVETPLAHVNTEESTTIVDIQEPDNALNSNDSSLNPTAEASVAASPTPKSTAQIASDNVSPLTRRRQSVSSIDELPTKKARQTENVDTEGASATPFIDLTNEVSLSQIVIDESNVPSGSTTTIVKQSTDQSLSTATTASTDVVNNELSMPSGSPSPVDRQPISQPPSTEAITPSPNQRKKTIADYFIKPTQKQVHRASFEAPINRLSKETNIVTQNMTETPVNLEPIVTETEPAESSIRQSATVENTIGNDSATEIISVEVSSVKATYSTTNFPAENSSTSTTVPEIEISATGILIPAAESTSNVTASESSPDARNADVHLHEGSSTETSTSGTSVNKTPAVRGPPTSVHAFKKGYSHRIKQINVYMEIRMKVLLALLEEQPMWDMGKELADKYTAKAAEIYGTSKYRACNRTLWRSAATLADRGEATIDVVECHMLNGQTIKKKILVRKDIDKDGIEYKIYKRNLKDRRIYQHVTSNAEKITTVEVPVETLEGRIDRMKQELQVLVDGEKNAESRALQQRINELSANAKKFRPSVPNKFISSWLITGIQFGWVRARMIRIKLLYMYIFSLLEHEESIEGVDKENRIINMNAVITNMPLSLYCNIIGVFEPPQIVVGYVRDPKNANTTYKTMPDQVRAELFSDKNKFRRRLRALVSGLEYLELITGLYVTPDGYEEIEKYGNLLPLFHMKNKVAVREPKKLGRPVVHEHTLDTAADAALYWSELQYISTHVEKDVPKEELEPSPSNSTERELWRGISNPANWSNASVYSRLQRKILNSYVDKVKGTTPLKSTSICTDIAEEIDSTLSYVRRYFAKVEVAIARKRKNRELRNFERRLQPIVRRNTKRRRNRDYTGRRVINLSSTRAFHSLYRPEKAYLKSESERSKSSNTQTSLVQNNDENSYMDDIDNAPVLTNDAMNLRLKRRKRTVWTPEDDELLIYSYVILRQRSVSRRAFRWVAMLQVFPHRDPQSFRHRLDRMLTDLVYMEQLETAATLWSRFYSEGIKRGEIEDPSPRETIDFDLLSFLTYFLKRLNDGEPLFQQVTLPSKVTDIYQNFDVIHGVANANPYYMEDRFFAATTLVTKMGTLYHQSLSARRVRENEYDTIPSSLIKENDVDERLVGCLRSYAMMTLLTPAENYDPFFAYSVLLSYPKHLYDRAIEEMRAEGILIPAKLNRAIPGSRFGLSAKLITVMNGKLPNDTLGQAKEYQKYLNEQTSSNRFVPEVVSSGMMACLMTLLSDYKLNISIANRSVKLKQVENAGFNTKGADRSMTMLDMDLQKPHSEEIQPNEPPSRELDAKKINEVDFDLQLLEFLKTQPESIKNAVMKIVNVLKYHKDQGRNLYQLKSEIDEEIDDTSIIQAIHILEQNDPPLLHVVGYKSSRYVLPPYIGTWFICTKDIPLQDTPQHSKSEKSACARATPQAPERKEIIKPKIWNDINGFPTEIVLKECKEVILDYIIRRPGSTEANIHRQFTLGFSRSEIDDILQSLVRDRTIKQVRIIQPNDIKTRKSIFSKTCSFKCTTKTVIEKNTQTCYWASIL